MVHVGFSVQQGKAIIESSITKITVQDFITPNSQFPNIIYSTIQNNTQQPCILSSKIYISPNEKVQYNIVAQIGSMTFIPAPLVIQKINECFQPSIENESLNDIELSLFLKFQEIKNNTQRKLKQILKKGNINIGLQMNINTPQIIIPENLSHAESKIILFSVGTISIINKDFNSSIFEINSLKFPENIKYSKYSSNLLETLYNTYVFDVKDIHLTLTSINSYFNYDDKIKDKNRIELMNPLDFFIYFDVCKFVDPRFPFFKILIQTPSVKLFLSSSSIQSILSIIDNYISLAQQNEKQKTAEHIINAIHQYKKSIKSKLYKNNNNSKHQQQQQQDEKLVKLTESYFINYKFSLHDLQILFEDDFQEEQNEFQFLLSLHEMEGEFESSSYQTQTLFHLNSISLFGELKNHEKNKKPIQLISTCINNDKKSNLSPELNDILSHYNNDKLMKIQWNQIPSYSPYYNYIDNQMNISIHQMIFYADLKMLDGLIRLYKRSIQYPKQNTEHVQENDEKYKEALMTSQKVIKSIVIDDENDEKCSIEKYFLNLSVTMNCFMILIPTTQRNIEISFSNTSSSLTCSYDLNEIKSNGNLSNVMINLPLLSNECYFPHVIFLKGTNGKENCKYNWIYNNNNLQSMECKNPYISLTIDNPTIIIPTEQQQKGNQKISIHLGEIICSRNCLTNDKAKTTLKITDFGIKLQNDFNDSFDILENLNANIVSLTIFIFAVY